MTFNRILERLLFGPEAAMRAEFWVNVNVLGDGAEFNHVFEHAGRGRGRAKFASEHYCHVAAREYTGLDARPNLVKESLGFECVKLSQRSYG
jgi:hypothetical protein